VPVLLYKLYGARTILNTIIQSLTPHNSMLNMSLVRHCYSIPTKHDGRTVLFVVAELLVISSAWYLFWRGTVRPSGRLEVGFKKEQR